MTDILIIEDNEEIAMLTAEFLRKENYTVSIAKDGEKALSLYEKYGARLVLLDISLPEIDGFAVCRKIREYSNTPIIVISARGSKDDKLKGLALGADDYIEKPCDIDILLAKIDGIFKRRYSRDEVTDGELTLNKTDSTAALKGVPIEITGKEFELLLLLVENKGQALTKDFLFRSVWGSDSQSELQTLTVHINRLREKIEQNPKKPEHIVTVWGTGYKYV